MTVPEGTSGAVKIERFTVSEASSRLFNLNCHGRPISPGTYTRLLRNGSVWMSDTPAERFDHLGAVNRAQSAAKNGRVRVLINGLGLGMVLQAMLAIPEVEHVDVVELDADVIALVGPHYQAMAGERLTIHHADAFTKTWPRGTAWDVVWHDIWLDVTAGNLPEMGTLKRKYARRAGWQGCWAQAECRWQR